MSSDRKPGYLDDLFVAPPPTQMEYNRLGSSGLKISKIVLGGMSYGSKEWAKWVLEEEEALPLLQYAYELGINTWDTVSTTTLAFIPQNLILTCHRLICIPMVAPRR